MYSKLIGFYNLDTGNCARRRHVVIVELEQIRDLFDNAVTTFNTDIGFTTMRYSDAERDNLSPIRKYPLPINTYEIMMAASLPTMAAATIGRRRRTGSLGPPTARGSCARSTGPTAAATAAVVPILGHTRVCSRRAVCSRSTSVI